MAERQIPIFAVGQITEALAEQWAQASTKNPPAWLECEPLRNEDGSVVCAGPVGYLYADVADEVQ